ncbi:MAG: cytochrome c biogenesis protein CcsA [Bacteroidota bacterium]
MEYVGEHLLPGQIGRLAIVLGFVASILASVAYFFATQRREQAEEASNWRKIGQWAFVVHGISFFTVIGILFYIMINHYYEYQYVQQHVSDDLPFRYIFSAFWQAQEGSFLLWMFWHIVLGFILIRKAREWEAPVLSVLSLVQMFIGTMLLGTYIYIGDAEYKIGSNPLMLLRDMVDAPVFSNSEYVELLEGSGMNPLLQNYWMTIHPPTLFLGFASTVVPFCYAIAGLWMNEHKKWLKAVTPWALFCGFILGTGILMGSAWAYEALTFGGYWAWDPVENMSLVPWIILVAGIHTNLVARSTGYSIKSTYLFYLLSFPLILYSTFLTRSGILGDTSAHAFTEMGLEWQLVGFLMTFLLLGLVLYAAKAKAIPAPVKEEGSTSKEFWIFIGTLVLLFSAVLITVSTSLPVYNKIVSFFDATHQDISITDPEEHHNKYQMWIGVFIGLLSGVAQYFRFREVNFKNYTQRFWKHTGGALAVSALLTWLTTLWIEVAAWQYILLLFSGIFAVVTNTDYLVSFARHNPKVFGASLSHIGFGLMLVGIIASGTNKFHISKNEFAMRNLLEDEEMVKENILLFKNEPMFMSGFMAEWTRDTVIGNTREYHININKLDKDGNTVETFQVTPNVIYDRNFAMAATNPSTKRALDKDIFTSLNGIPPEHKSPEDAKAVEDSLKWETYSAVVGDTIFGTEHYAVIQSVNRNPSHPDYRPEEGDIAVGVKMAVRREKLDTTFYAEPVLVLRGQLLYNYPAKINALAVSLKLPEEIFASVFTPDGALKYETFTVKEGESFRYKDYVINLAGFNRNPTHPQYQNRPTDIAVGAILSVTKGNRTPKVVEPLYYIRDSRPMNLKDDLPEWNFHVRFTTIDPNSGAMTFEVAEGEQQQPIIPVAIAENAYRTDYVVLEAIVFPGINFFWLGSTLMMIGLLVSFIKKRMG